jgi:hypothetical protein
MVPDVIIWDNCVKNIRLNFKNEYDVLADGINFWLNSIPCPVLQGFWKKYCPNTVRRGVLMFVLLNRLMFSGTKKVRESISPRILILKFNF